MFIACCNSQNLRFIVYFLSLSFAVSLLFLISELFFVFFIFCIVRCMAWASELTNVISSSLEPWKSWFSKSHMNFTFENINSQKSFCTFFVIDLRKFVLSSFFRYLSTRRNSIFKAVSRFFIKMSFSEVFSISLNELDKSFFSSLLNSWSSCLTYFLNTYMLKLTAVNSSCVNSASFCSLFFIKTNFFADFVCSCSETLIASSP